MTVPARGMMNDERRSDPTPPDEGKPLRGLAAARSVYEVPKDSLASELLIPAMRAASSVRIMVGFFSSQSFSQLAPGLAAFIEGGAEPLQLLVSPNLSAEDQEAIRRALVEPEDMAVEAFRRLLEDARSCDSAIAAHTAACLTYLLATQRLDLRFVLMKQGLFHPKVWIFEADGDFLAVHGSNNLTAAGLLYNGEIVSVDRPWRDGAAAANRVDGLRAMFDAYWTNQRDYSVTVGPSVGLLISSREHIAEPTVAEFWRAWDEDQRRKSAPPIPTGIGAVAVSEIAEPTKQALEIPRDLSWETGIFSHQGAAVRAWEANDRTGVLAIATGGGKTTSALVGATRLQNATEDPLLVLVLVPSDPLLDQWAREVERFGVVPHPIGRIPAAERIAALHGIEAALTHGIVHTEVIISSNQLFVGSEPLRAFFRNLPKTINVLLVADEVHNLGVPSFLADPPATIKSRLGLSATPIRQYDADGTAELLNYFGEVVFEFDLGKAIRAGCLTPYHYHLHEIHLSREELDVWEELTEKLRKRGFGTDDDGQTGGLEPAIQRLLERRRAVLEHAEAKLGMLRDLLAGTPASAVARTLIYTSAKSDPLHRGRQITNVNRLLNELGILSHQLTYTETGGATARRLLDDFATGRYQALSCMKVLDEGLDVPATSTAYLLASSTVRREWIQRRGRVLRKAPGKSLAHLHDFLVVPPDLEGRSGRSILRSELARAEEFCRLADNAWDNDGPRSVTERYS